MLTAWMPGTADLRTIYADETGYVIGLSAVHVAVGVLTIGLVRPWGEQLLGIAVPRWFPIVVGGVGGLALTWLFTIDLPIALLSGVRPDQGTVHAGALVMMVACYAPMLLWGPLTLAAVAGYGLRRYRIRSFPTGGTKG